MAPSSDHVESSMCCDEEDVEEGLCSWMAQRVMLLLPPVLVGRRERHEDAACFLL